MDYCGIEFTAIESPDGSSWKWQISILDKDKIKTSGHAANRAAAIEQAHEAIGEGLRANASPEPEVQLPHQIHNVLHILHGARSLPSSEAVAALRPFLNAVRDRVAKSDRIAVASVAAVEALIHRLENQGIANDDLWEEAIESSLSFANEVSYPGTIRPISQD
jgi:hypothetical protein